MDVHGVTNMSLCYYVSTNHGQDGGSHPLAMPCPFFEPGQTQEERMASEGGRRTNPEASHGAAGGAEETHRW